MEDVSLHVDGASHVSDDNFEEDKAEMLTGSSSTATESILEMEVIPLDPNKIKRVNSRKVLTKKLSERKNVSFTTEKTDKPSDRQHLGSSDGIKNADDDEAYKGHDKPARGMSIQTEAYAKHVLRAFDTVSEDELNDFKFHLEKVVNSLKTWDQNREGGGKIQVVIDRDRVDMVQKAESVKNYNAENHVDDCELRKHCPCLCCWDEEDDGIPPFCQTKWGDEPPVPKWKLLNEYNTCTNYNSICWLFGAIGFKMFDVRRRTFMAIAMYSTFISIFFTIYGVSAYSLNPAIIKATYWAEFLVQNTTSGQKETLHMGLRGMVHRQQPCDVFHGCIETLYEYPCNLFGCSTDDQDTSTWPSAFLADEIGECRNVLEIESMGIMLTCITLVFALIGTANRMRYRADLAIQKALGMVTDSVGFVTLLMVLNTAGNACFEPFPTITAEGSELSARVGPGYACYIMCLVGAFARVFFHWLTPTPKQWKPDARNCAFGTCCCFNINDMQIPATVRKHFQDNPDGQIECRDVFRFCSSKAWTHLHLSNLMEANYDWKNRQDQVLMRWKDVSSTVGARSRKGYEAAANTAGAIASASANTASAIKNRMTMAMTNQPGDIEDPGDTQSFTRRTSVQGRMSDNISMETIFSRPDNEISTGVGSELFDPTAAATYHTTVI